MPSEEDLAAATKTARRIESSVGWSRHGTVQGTSIHTGAVAPVRGWPVVHLRRWPAVQEYPDGPDPKLLLGVRKAITGELEGYIPEIIRGNGPPGTGASMWGEIRDSANGAGIETFRLVTKGLGGWFWAAQGFAIDGGAREAEHLLFHMRGRAELLDQHGVPLPAQLIAWLSSTVAVSQLVKEGLPRWLLRVPALEVPWLDEDGVAATGRGALLRAALLVYSSWPGVLRLTGQGAGVDTTPIGDLRPR